MRTRIVLAAALVIALVAAGSAVGAPPGATLEFRISFVSNVRSDPATGRVYVIVSSDAKPQPRFQVDILGPPFWGKDVTDVPAGQQMTIDTGTDVYGYPLTSVDQLPDGDYTVQAFLNVYTTFTRSDGSVVQLHMPCGDGGYFLDSPGNLYSAPVQMHLSPSAGPVNLILDQAITPSDPVPNGGTCQQGNPKSSPHVKHVKIKSQMLTKYWGQPMYIAANVLLPEGYSASANAGVRYPVVFLQGHFPFGNPFGFKESLANKFSRWWASNAAPRVIVVEFRHENPFFDDSYAVNSANLGPYGDAMVKELIPVLERRFRMIGEPWARTVTGGSTGGWEALAQQVFYPSFYGGAWSLCPDPVDFRYHQLVNVYSADNAYFTPYEWEQVPRPSAREVPGDTIWTMEQENHWELALGTNGRSQLGQWDVWQAVYGPQGADGYPAPIWDKVTGAIDHAVATQWHPMDIRWYLNRHWSSLGPKLAGKIKLWVGDDDTFFLNDAVELLQDFLDGVQNPIARAEFHYGKNKPHCFGPYGAKLVGMMANAVAANAPAGANTSAWLTARPAAAPAARLTSEEAYGPRAPGR
jgi:enterochelin esterase-like enzyme